MNKYNSNRGIHYSSLGSRTDTDGSFQSFTHYATDSRQIVQNIYGHAIYHLSRGLHGVGMLNEVLRLVCLYHLDGWA